MEIFETIMGILLIAFALFLVVAVLMQNGKEKGLSGAISGGAETFFGKEKGKKIDSVLAKLTTVVSIVFVVIVLVLYIIQPNVVYNQTDAERPTWENSEFYDSDVIDPAE